jgi:hypothetical protein
LLLSRPGYIGWRLLPPLTDDLWGLTSGIGVLVGVCLPILRSIRVRPKGGGLALWLTWSGLIAMEFFSTLFLATLRRDAVLAGAVLVLPVGAAAAWVRPSAVAVLVLTAASCVLNWLRARHSRLVEVAVLIRGLPPALDGFSIAQIPDLHVEPTIRRGFVARLGLSVLKTAHVVHLQISGHTLGGQFLLWNFFVGFFQPFTAGLYRRTSLSVYVSCGTGYWGAPNRFGVLGEITRLRLVPA